MIARDPQAPATGRSLSLPAVVSGSARLMACAVIADALRNPSTGQKPVGEAVAAENSSWHPLDRVIPFRGKTRRGAAALREGAALQTARSTGRNSPRA